MTPHRSDFFEACRKDDLEKIKFLLEFQPEKEIIEDALGSACFVGCPEIVEYLLDIVDVKHSDSAIEIASNMADFEEEATPERHQIALKILNLLLSKGANFSKLTTGQKYYFQVLKFFRRWRKKIFLKKLFEIALPLYYSPGFPGSNREIENLKKYFLK